MPPPYYGSVDALKAFNRNVKSLANPDAPAQIEAFDAAARAEMESDLAAAFVQWPEPDGTMANVLSVLWLYKMTELIQSEASATVRVRGEYGEQTLSRYDKLLGEIKSGAKIVPGAIRRKGAAPRALVFASPAIAPNPNPGTPREIQTVWQRGLRV
jgi:hypothetical protein